MQRLLSFGQRKAAGASSTLACPVVVKGKTQEHQFKIKVVNECCSKPTYTESEAGWAHSAAVAAAAALLMCC
jgi:hypothetical protein